MNSLFFLPQAPSRCLVVSCQQEKQEYTSYLRFHPGDVKALGFRVYRGLLGRCLGAFLSLFGFTSKETIDGETLYVNISSATKFFSRRSNLKSTTPLSKRIENLVASKRTPLSKVTLRAARKKIFPKRAKSSLSERIHRASLPLPITKPQIHTSTIKSTPKKKPKKAIKTLSPQKKNILSSFLVQPDIQKNFFTLVELLTEMSKEDSQYWVAALKRGHSTQFIQCIEKQALIREEPSTLTPVQRKKVFKLCEKYPELFPSYLQDKKTYSLHKQLIETTYTEAPQVVYNYLQENPNAQKILSHFKEKYPSLYHQVLLLYLNKEEEEVTIPMKREAFLVDALQKLPSLTEKGQQRWIRESAQFLQKEPPISYFSIASLFTKMEEPSREDIEISYTLVLSLLESCLLKKKWLYSQIMEKETLKLHEKIWLLKLRPWETEETPLEDVLCKAFIDSEARPADLALLSSYLGKEEQTELQVIVDRSKPQDMTKSMALILFLKLLEILIGFA